MIEFASPFHDEHIDAVLVDSYSLSTRGGTGQAYNWGLAAVTLFAATKKRKVAAGGLDPENVAAAVSILKPWGVDVASGVEASPGRKDPEKVRQFIANARAVIPA
jgi:phosphoribosylanthranilate isomerase